MRRIAGRFRYLNCVGARRIFAYKADVIFIFSFVAGLSPPYHPTNIYNLSDTYFTVYNIHKTRIYIRTLAGNQQLSRSRAKRAKESERRVSVNEMYECVCILRREMFIS